MEIRHDSSVTSWRVPCHRGPVLCGLHGSAHRANPVIACPDRQGHLGRRRSDGRRAGWRTKGGLDHRDVGGQRRAGRLPVPARQDGAWEYTVRVRAVGYKLPDDVCRRERTWHAAGSPAPESDPGNRAWHAALQYGVADERAGHTGPEGVPVRVRELPLAAARAVLPFRRAGDGAGGAADAPPYEQLVAAASLDASCRRFSARPPTETQHDVGKYPQLDQSERARHIRVSAEDPAASEGQGDAGDLHRLRAAAARRIPARHGLRRPGKPVVLGFQFPVHREAGSQDGKGRGLRRPAEPWVSNGTGWPPDRHRQAGTTLLRQHVSNGTGPIRSED